MECGEWYLRARIDNLDTVNSLNLLQSPNGIPTVVDPQTSAEIVDEVRDYFEIVPDGTTGNYQFEVQLVTPAEMRRVGLV